MALTILELFNQELSQLQRLLPWLVALLWSSRFLCQNRKKVGPGVERCFFAGFRNHGSRQQRHLADTYKASSDQPFHQRTSKSGLFAARQPPTTGPHADQAVAKLIREKPTAILSTEQFVPIQSVELKLSGKVLVLPAPTPSDPSFLANDFICPPVRYLSKWKLDSKYRQMLQQLDNWQSWKGRQT